MVTTRSRPLRLWVTRAEPGATATAARLAERGHIPLVAPLLRLERLAVEAAAVAQAVREAAALAFTSRPGVEAFAALTPDRSLPVFAVGDATAHAVRVAGWTQVKSARGDGPALAGLIGASRPPGPVLAPGARETAFDLSAALAQVGVHVRALPLYAAHPVDRTPTEAAALLSAGALDGLLLHSPAAARALAACAAADAGFARLLRPLAAYALSPACAAPTIPFLDAAPASATAPNEAELLALLPLT